MTDASAIPFGELLRQHRLARDLTQEALAEQAGISDRSIRALERGQNRPQRQTAGRLVDALGLEGEALDCFLSAAGPAPRQSRRFAGRLAFDDPMPLPTALVGRERELAEIGALLAREDGCLLTLTGPAGVGKTRLALEVARRVTDNQADGAVFVALASLNDPDLVLPAVAREIHVAEGNDQPLAALISALADRRLLLVLDNFEHLLEAAPAVGALQAACPALRVLVTSRSLLRLRAEQNYPIQPLTVPAGCEAGPLAPAALDAVERAPSVHLFTARARAVKPDFALTASNGWTVAEICRHVDGLPLAIELAAARAAILSPQALLVQLAHPLRLLTSGARDLPERQRTLRTAIAWSYDLLGPDEQVLFRRLSVFAGGCELGAIEAVCIEDLSIDPLDGATALAEANLLVVGDGDEPRFRMLETIREFAREELARSGEGDEIRRRHAAYFLAVAESASRQFMGPNHVEEFRRVDRELDNIRAALRWLRESVDLNGLSRLAAALFYYWYINGSRREGRAWLEDALRLMPADARTSERAGALAASGGLAILISDFEGARRELEESVAIWRELGGGRGLSQALAHLAIALANLGEADRSWATCEESLAVARAGGDLLYVGLGLHGLGVGLAWGQHHFDAAGALYEEALDAFRLLGSGAGRALVLNSLGDMARLQGDFAEARERYEQSLELAPEASSRSHRAILLHNLGHTVHCLGDDLDARQNFCESLVLFRDMGDTRGVAECVAGLACLEAEERPERAARWFGSARAAAAAIGTELSVSNATQYDAAFAMARLTLGDQAFEAALAADPMQLEMAVKEALES